MQRITMLNLWPATLLLLLCPVCGFAEEGDEKQNTELAWVKSLTTKFFELGLAVVSERDYSTPLTVFLSPELNLPLKDEKSAGGPLVMMAVQYPGGTFRVKSAEMAPSGNEVVLSGVLTPQPEVPGPAKRKQDDEEPKRIAALALGYDFFGFDAKQARQDKEADVNVLVTRDTTSGLWVIRFVRVKVRGDEKTK